MEGSIDIRGDLSNDFYGSVTTCTIVVISTFFDSLCFSNDAYLVNDEADKLCVDESHSFDIHHHGSSKFFREIRFYSIYSFPSLIRRYLAEQSKSRIENENRWGWGRRSGEVEEEEGTAI